MKKSLRQLYLAAAILFTAVLAGRCDTTFVANSGAGQVIEYGTNGGGLIFGSVSTPEGIIYDTNGTLYVATYYTGTIVRFNSLGQSSVFATGLNFPHGLVFDPSGNLFVSGDDGQILKITPAGVKSVFAQGLNYPYDLVFDSDGNLFVASVHGNTVLKYDPQGQSTVFAAAGLDQPAGLAFDSGGNLYVSCAGNNSIKKYTPLGVGSTFATNSGMNSPIGLSFDSAGNLLVANYGANNVLKFDSLGNGSVFASLGLVTPAYVRVLPDLHAPPALYTQPASQVVQAGSTVQFSVFAGGSPNLTFQWQHEGTNIPAATACSLTVSNIQVSDTGLYTVAVTNAYGGIVSAPASILLKALDVQLLAELTIQGPVGSNVQVDYSLNLQTWFPLTNFVLPGSPYKFIDLSSAGAANRFYRVNFGP